MRKELLFVLSVMVLIACFSCKSKTDEDDTPYSSAPKDISTANVVKKTFSSDIAGIDITLTYNASETGTDYKVSSVPLSGNIKNIGAEYSSIFVGFNARKVQNFSIPGDKIAGIVHMAYKMDLTDKTDYVYLSIDSVFIIHTYGGIGGSLASTSVYEVPKYSSGYEYMQYFSQVEKQNANRLGDGYQQLKTFFLYNIIFCYDNKLDARLLK